MPPSISAMTRSRPEELNQGSDMGQASPGELEAAARLNARAGRPLPCGGWIGRKGSVVGGPKSPPGAIGSIGPSGLASCPALQARCPAAQCRRR
jgi:hypothetical protein